MSVRSVVPVAVLALAIVLPLPASAAPPAAKPSTTPPATTTPAPAATPPATSSTVVAAPAATAPAPATTTTTTTTTTATAPAATATAPAAASAPAPASSAGNASARVRVHVDTDFFGFTHFDPDASDSTDANVNTLGFGLGRLTLIDGGTALFDRSLLAFGVGAVILGGRAVVGARAAFVMDGVLRDSSNSTTFGGRLVPYFNYMFKQSGRVRPYIGVRLGFGGGSATIEGEFAGDATRDRVNVIYPLVGAQGGVHVFLTDRISLDPGLSLDYAAPFGKTKRIEPASDTDPDLQFVGHVLNAAITLGLSMWI